MYTVPSSPVNVGGARSGCNTPKKSPEMIETSAAPAMIFVIVSRAQAFRILGRVTPAIALPRREPVVGGRLAPFFLVVFVHAIIVVLGRQ